MAEPLHPKPDHSRSNPKPRRLRQAVAVALGLALSLIAAEAMCRLYARELEEQWQELLAQPGHYYVPSDNPTLVYQLRPEYLFRWMGRQLQINRYGIRDWNDDLAEGKRRVGLLGDSALFGIWQTQFATITDRTQELLDPEQQRLKVFNLGVPGYGIAELAEQLRVKDSIYRFDDVVYLLNLNDFCRRDSVYEGADNSLYRIYRRPRWWSRHFLRKAIYRLRKHGSLIESNETSDGWYRWLFEGNREFARRHLKAIVDHTRRNGIRFTVILLPAGSAFEPSGEYRLADLHRSIASLLKAEGVKYSDSSGVFAEDTQYLINETEHPSILGNQKLAELVAAWVRAGDSHRLTNRREVPVGAAPGAGS